MFALVFLFSGGVMLVHNIRKNETRVIDFRETAPFAIHEDMLQTNLDINVRLFSRAARYIMKTRNLRS